MPDKTHHIQNDLPDDHALLDQSYFGFAKEIEILAERARIVDFLENEQIRSLVVAAAEDYARLHATRTGDLTGAQSYFLMNFCENVLPNLGNASDSDFRIPLRSYLAGDQETKLNPAQIVILNRLERNLGERLTENTVWEFAGRERLEIEKQFEMFFTSYIHEGSNVAPTADAAKVITANPCHYDPQPRELLKKLDDLSNESLNWIHRHNPVLLDLSKDQPLAIDNVLPGCSINLDQSLANETLPPPGALGLSKIVDRINKHKEVIH
jgi:hypothetical protein